MNIPPYLLGIDQGSSGSRALILDHAGQVCGYGYQPLSAIYPQEGWVEQDPYLVVESVKLAITEALSQAGCHPAEIAACGIAGQRNTHFAWDVTNGRAVGNAISWQDLRTLPMLPEVEAWPLAAECRRRLGYSPGPYSAALHLAWRVRHDAAFARAVEKGSLRVGLSPAWLMVALGQPTGHQMDYSLVQALGLYDFRARQYWAEWLDFLNIPQQILPTAVPTLHNYGTLTLTAADGATADVPVLAMIGDQQAALFGHECRQPGDAECTHGTATFVDVFMGDKAPEQEKTNVYFAWSLPDKRKDSPDEILHTYCLEADTTVTGAAIRWMRRNARLFDRDEEVSELAASVVDAGGVVFVPAFTGLNVPYHNHEARGTILGLALSSTRAHIARAFLEAIGYQVRAILETIQIESGVHVKRLHVGGGIAASNIACQILADQLGLTVIRPAFTEMSARAAALLAGLGVAVWPDVAALPPLPNTRTHFEPRLTAVQRDKAYGRWQRAVAWVEEWGLGTGDQGPGIRDRGSEPIPDPQPPIPTGNKP